MKNPTKRAMDKLHRPQVHEDRSKDREQRESFQELVREAEEMGMYETRTAKVVVWSDVVGYMTAHVPLGVLESAGQILIFDELGHRPELETPSNIELAERILEL